MDNLESQVAKIQLGNPKNASTYVHVLAEPVEGSTTELYMVAELPLLNPAALPACQKIALSISGALKRTYKREMNENTFENAVAYINDELGKLAETGQTHWVNKLSCILAVKQGHTLSISTCGKVTAYLLRAGEFTDISTSSTATHPLKTFENVAIGKLRVDDITILSTTQLFNHISIDRLKQIFDNQNFPTATRTITELLKDNAGPDVAFGAILNLQVVQGTALEDTENGRTDSAQGRFGALATVPAYFKKAFSLANPSRIPNVSLPKVAGSLKSIRGSTAGLADRSRVMLERAKRAVKTGGQNVNLQKFQDLSKQKKFFLASAGVLLLAFFINLAISSRVHTSKQVQSTTAGTLKKIQDTISHAQNAATIKDEATLKADIANINSLLPTAADVPADQQTAYKDTLAQLTSLKHGIEKTQTVNATSIGNLSAADSLINVSHYLATQTNGNIISLDLASNLVQDGQLKANQPIVRSVAVSPTAAAVYTGSSLRIWNPTAGTFGPEFTENVPAAADFGGLAFYPTNSRVYLVNKKTSQIISFIVANQSFSKPLVYNKDPFDAGNVQDMAIDGNIYLLTSSGITKFQTGSATTFNFPILYTPLGSHGRIYTQSGYSNVYVLDRDNNRIIVLDKKGTLVGTITSDQFTKLKDFTVDEKARTVTVLNDTTLLKASF